MDFRKFDAMVMTMPEHIRDAWADTDLASARRMAAETPDDMPADKLQIALEYSLGLVNEDDMEDLMDGDLEDQLANLLIAGDEEDRRTRYNTADLIDFTEPRHAMDDLEKRYVILTKLRGRYMPDVASDDLDYIMHEAVDIAYQSLDAALHEAKTGGEASVTVFDRDEDRDLYHVELIYYPKGAVDR